MTSIARVDEGASLRLHQRISKHLLEARRSCQFSLPTTSLSLCSHANAEGRCGLLARVFLGHCAKSEVAVEEVGHSGGIGTAGDRMTRPESTAASSSCSSMAREISAGVITLELSSLII